MSDLTARADLLAQIESQRRAKAILYATGDRDGLETRIGQDVIDLFVDHLDDIGPVERIALLLYTSGGNTSAAWNIVNLVRMFCDDFEVIAPGKCMRIPFQMNTYAARTGSVDYSFTRAVIESTVHGARHFVSEGRVETTELTTVDGPALKQTAVQDQRTFDGWRKVHVP